MLHQWKKGARRLLLENPLYKVVEEVHTHPAIPDPIPFWIVDSRDWVNVIAVDKDSLRDSSARILLVKQYRVGCERVTWELPGGSCEENDPTPLHTARRELLEESGASGVRWVYLGSMSPNAAFYRNRTHCFVAFGCRIDPQAVIGDGREVIEPEWVPWTEHHRLILDGKVDHGLVIANFTLADAHLATDSEISRQL